MSAYGTKMQSSVPEHELASYLYNYLSNNFRPEDIELRMGNIELLFKLSSRLKINSVKELEPVLKSVKFERTGATFPSRSLTR